ncbi:MAG: late competence development ComFB family protein [Treponema sp.]|jgi:competence protein ComFB|nr:late competence development ComFB family protein [Treponema sp.]
MDLHNTNEDSVIAKVNDIFDSIEKKGNPEKICSCSQCRIDTACYVLNRIKPHYVVSSRGVARIGQEAIAHQQVTADIVTLIWEGLKQINHNQRPFFSHNRTIHNNTAETSQPVFTIPTIVGRLFNGLNFAPMADVQIELLHKGELIPMLDSNWQNPYHLVPHTTGTFTFWPAPIQAEAANLHQNVRFSIKVEAEGFEKMKHFFEIPVISEVPIPAKVSTEQILKLPDLYLFPLGGEDRDRFLD